jgi:hypothetical protein
MAENKSPNPKRTEIILAWLGWPALSPCYGGWWPNSSPQKN